ncbi:Thioredoxin_domain-containing protein [Hexamita inflata]|uniref:Thioredoxin domain-containing protein n=1 Tax=Hexamita inflata TaxID=28002 RepID=A0AA86NS89_9EUKA|nr:Thioredoxin domain-containing protein [Hexamita inflata]CAI9971795.1 Thioredoxin domain-containing protein [Hexamita inflata]
MSSESSAEIETLGGQNAISGADMELFMKRRKEELQQEFKEQQLIMQNQHGQLLEIHESVFLDHISRSDRSVAHFYLDDFQPCRELNTMLEKVAKQHVECKFVKIKADDAMWFINKFKIQTLPSTIVAVNGKIVKKFIGLEEFGNEYPNEISLKRALSQCGAIFLKENELTRTGGLFGYEEGIQQEDSW